MSLRNASLTCLAVSVLAFSLGAAKQDSDPIDKSILKLQEQRVELVAHMADIARKQHKDGVGSFQDVLRAESELLDAKLELTTTAEQRIKLREEQLELAARHEEQLSKLVKQGVVDRPELMRAKIERLLKQIELLKEKKNL